MYIPKFVKLVVLVLTLWVPLYMLGFFALMTSPTLIAFDTLFALHAFTMLVEMVLLLFYVVHLFKTKHVEAGKKALWGISLFGGGPIAMPIYWFVHLWPDSPWAMPENTVADRGLSDRTSCVPVP